MIYDTHSSGGGKQKLYWYLYNKAYYLKHKKSCVCKVRTDGTQ